MYNKFLWIISIILIANLISNSNAGQGHRQASLVSARIADAYNDHLENNEKRLIRQARAGPGPRPGPGPNPTSTSKTTTISGTGKFCPFNPSLVCNASRKYQSFDGVCNNLKNPLYGAMNTPYKRFLTPTYGDGKNTPRSLSASGAALPNARLISRTIFQNQQTLERRWFHLFASFGQFMVHDMTSLAASSDLTGKPTNCPCGSTNPNCLNIAIPTNDKVMGAQTCIQFTRSSPSFQSVDCVNQTYREQLNQLSSFLDCSQIYGSSVAISNSLRSFQKGQMLTSALLSSSNYLKKSATDKCSTDGNAAYKCFQAGEDRTNENLGLTSIHTLFLREHNRIALKLSTINPTWSDDTLFYETRRIIQAVYQHISYSDWIPATVGRGGGGGGGNNLNDLNPQPAGQFYRGYNSSTNAQLYNEIAAAILRFGHTEIADIYNRSKSDGTFFPNGGLKFSSINFLVAEAYNTNNGMNGIESIFLGLINSKASLTGLGIADSLQNRLFASPNFTAGLQIDLPATNINRGRDHGIPSYNAYRQLCGLGLASTFSALSNTMSAQSIAKLQSVYTNVNDIDLWVGGLAEGAFISNNRIDDTFRQPGSVVGATFNCLLRRQFIDLKRGDRFFYENAPDANLGTSSTAFTIGQLNAIRSVTISQLICSNFNVNAVRPFLFEDPPQGTANDPLPCSSYTSIDLSQWTQTNG